MLQRRILARPFKQMKRLSVRLINYFAFPSAHKDRLHQEPWRPRIPYRRQCCYAPAQQGRRGFSRTQGPCLISACYLLSSSCKGVRDEKYPRGRREFDLFFHYLPLNFCSTPCCPYKSARIPCPRCTGCTSSIQLRDPSANLGHSQRREGGGHHSRSRHSLTLIINYSGIDTMYIKCTCTCLRKKDSLTSGIARWDCCRDRG